MAIIGQAKQENTHENLSYLITVDSYYFPNIILHFPVGIIAIV